MTAARYEVGRGEPVVLVHGLADDHRAWRRVVAPLMLTRRVVLYDLRGHGGSPLGDADGSLAQLGADLVDVLDDAEIDRAVIAGFSLGGTIAMRAAIDAPDRVAGLALVGTSSRVNSAARGWYEERAALVENDDPELRATLDADTEDVYRNRPEEIEAGLRIRRESTDRPARLRQRLPRHGEPQRGAARRRAGRHRRADRDRRRRRRPALPAAGVGDHRREDRAQHHAGARGHRPPAARRATGRGRRRDRGGERLMGISISIGISPRESLADYTRFTGELEQRGVDELWLIDSQLAMKDAYIGLALAAAQTESMRLGTGVSNLITRHPTVTANAIAAIAELSNGRAMLGLGAGDSAVYGVGARPSRVAEVEEGLEFFGAVLDGREGTWQGRGFQLAQEIPRTPVYLAVSQPRMCRLAGRLADGVIVMGPAQPDILTRQLGWITDGIEEAGRSRSDVRVCFIATLSAREDREAALADVRSWASAQARLQASVKELPPSLEPFREEIKRAKEDYDYGEHLSTRARHQGTVSDELVRTLAISGTTDECVERARTLLDTGVDDLIFPLLGGGRLERLQVLTEQIAPEVVG